MKLKTKIILAALTILISGTVIVYAQFTAPARPTGLRIVSYQNEYGKVTYGPKQNQLSVTLFDRE